MNDELTKEQKIGLTILASIMLIISLATIVGICLITIEQIEMWKTISKLLD